MLTKGQTDYIKKVAAKHPEVPTSKLLSYMNKNMREGVSAQVLEQLVGVHKVEGFYTKKPASTVRTKARLVSGLSREQFAATFDNDTRIRNALMSTVAWLETQDELFDDATIRAKCACPSIGWRLVSAEPAFKKYQFCIKNRVFWASRATRSWALNSVQGTSEL